MQLRQPIGNKRLIAAPAQSTKLDGKYHETERSGGAATPARPKQHHVPRLLPSAVAPVEADTATASLHSPAPSAPAQGIAEALQASPTPTAVLTCAAMCTQTMSSSRSRHHLGGPQHTYTKHTPGTPEPPWPRVGSHQSPQHGPRGTPTHQNSHSLVTQAHLHQLGAPSTSPRGPPRLRRGPLCNRLLLQTPKHVRPLVPLRPDPPPGPSGGEYHPLPRRRRELDRPCRDQGRVLP